MAMQEMIDVRFDNIVESYKEYLQKKLNMKFNAYEIIQIFEPIRSNDDPDELKMDIIRYIDIEDDKDTIIVVDIKPMLVNNERCIYSFEKVAIWQATVSKMLLKKENESYGSVGLELLESENIEYLYENKKGFKYIGTISYADNIYDSKN